MKRIKSLDGLRAISILMVLLAHARPTMPRFLTDNFVFEIVSNSQLGVTIFFVLSGYLITKTLIIEDENTGFIDVRQFFMRRALRLLPIFYLYILAIILLKLFFIPDIINKVSDVIPAAFYFWNYKNLLTPISGNANWFLGHFWSLSMEEQFYLLWPFVFIIFYCRQSLSKFNFILITILVLMPMLRVGTYYFSPENRGNIRWMLHTGGDAILMGCLGALIEKTSNFRRIRIKYLTNKWLSVSTVLFLFLISPYFSITFGGAYNLPFGMSLDNIFILIFIFQIMYIETSFSKLLSSKVLVHLGVLSYSLYVWQQIFLTDRYQYWFNLFPQNLIIVFVTGFFSFHLIEKPILNLRKKLSRDAALKLNADVSGEIIIP